MNALAIIKESVECGVRRPPKRRQSRAEGRYRTIGVFAC
jgi:hypothetical protein